ncbi:MAG: polymer-forming cytoskeletal protein [Desulfobulbaceae bacterium]
MSLFNKKEPEPQESKVMPVKPVKTSSSSNDVISSVISSDMRINGEVHFKGKARIDGVVEGNIHGDHLVLSESGKVIGDLELTTFICHGSVEGNVNAQQVAAHSSSSLRGNLVAASLTVESGARLNGEVSSSAQPPHKKSAPAPAATTAKPETEKKEAPKN